MKFLHLSCGLLLSILALSCQILSTNAYTDTTTSGASGPVCPPNAQCLSDALCINNKCKCQNPTPYGLGHFICHRQSEIFCAVFNDPYILGYDGSTTYAPLSCKFRLTDILIPFCRTNDPDNAFPVPGLGSCTIKVKAWGARLRGKTFIKGVDAKFMLTKAGSGNFHHLVRIIATANNGFYFFQESGTQTPFGTPTAGPALNLTVPGTNGRKIYTTYDTENNFARIVAEMCGVEVGIRGVDSFINPKATTAGIYIKVNKGCMPNFVNPGENLCSPPTGMGTSLADKAKELSAAAGREVSTSVAAMHVVMTSDVDQSFPGAAPVLAELTKVASECSDKLYPDAVEQSGFILNDIKFMRCFDKTESLEKALDLFKNAMYSICTNNSFVCGEVQKEVTMSNCTVASPKGTIMERECEKIP